MKYAIEIQYKEPPWFSTTAEANTKSHAEQLAIAHARQNGFKAKPKKIIVKEITK
jgi:hypothetical protein